MQHTAAMWLSSMGVSRLDNLWRGLFRFGPGSAIFACRLFGVDQHWKHRKVQTFGQDGRTMGQTTTSLQTPVRPGRCQNV